MEIIEQQNIPNDVQNEQPLQPPEKKRKKNNGQKKTLTWTSSGMSQNISLLCESLITLPT